MATEYSPLTVRAALVHAATRLRPLDSALLDAQVLLGHALGRSRAELMVRGEELIAPERLVEFQHALERRAGGEPLAYIIGRREFWSLNLQVSPAVLVPRPETELVVERCLALLGEPAAEIADLGTGSGAIALALAFERRGWMVTATDRSAAALAIADANARALGINNVRFVRGDWLEPLRGQRFDVIASNPPYIAAANPALLDPALRHEPIAALASGASGLEDLSTVVAGAPAHLHGEGWLVLEHDPGQAQALAELLVVRGFRHVRCHDDLAGRARVTEAQWPAEASLTMQAHSP